MKKNPIVIKVPEVLAFARALTIGFVLAEVFRIAYIGGGGLVDRFNPVCFWLVMVFVSLVSSAYAWLRGVGKNVVRFWRSRRVDLLISLVLGIWAHDILLPLMKSFHEHIKKSDPAWTLLVAAFLLLMIVSSLVRALWALRKRDTPQMYFLADDAIQDDADDALENKKQATVFAQIVVNSGSNTGLVYGIDGPWGTGKSSFINLANKYWQEEARKEVIVFRFEPLRYASDPDLAERLIRELSAEISRQVFVPEFRTAANRYSRMLNGKANFSFLGFKLDIEPSNETIDELLEDIDDVLKRIRRRLIIVIDDLDRLESKAVNNVLFTVQRTFKLTQAAYILCYDTENLVSNKDEGERARQFLEKFVNVKSNLFVDNSALVKFLRRGWVEKNKGKYPSIPSDTMFKLGSLLSELANILEDEELSARYMPLIGDMRKVKRFINAALLMRFEKVESERTDFDNRDLINLTLLHLNYPGVFRRIYAEETDGRKGVFSINTDSAPGSTKYVNEVGYKEVIETYKAHDKFLLNQLFEVNTLELDTQEVVKGSIRASRACFNDGKHRNLESYLALMVRFRIPDPRDTFRLYQDAVTRVIGGLKIETVFLSSDFALNKLDKGEVTHDEFWRILVNQSHDFSSSTADDSIDTLVEYLPRYSSVSSNDRALRHRSIYTLILLLDRAGWGRTLSTERYFSRTVPNTPENVIEISHRILGEKKYTERGLIGLLWSDDRGVLGLYDLLLFRLQCSADRQGQIFNLQRALNVHDDINAVTTGVVTGAHGLAVAGMRTMSQRIFSLFKLTYIDTKRNLFDDIDGISNDAFFGDSMPSPDLLKREPKGEVHNAIESTRALCKTFIVYQLANRQAGTGSGVGCGFYDVEGTNDGSEIAKLLNDYIFGVCFNPLITEKNVEHFLNYCLLNLSSGILSGSDERGYYPTEQSLANELDVGKLAEYWKEHKDTIEKHALSVPNATVITSTYIATYKDDLLGVFSVLNEILASKDKGIGGI